MKSHHCLVRIFAPSILSLLFTFYSYSQVIRNTVGMGQYTVPANVCAIYVEVIGAGGGGGYSGSNGQTTGGGGGGAYAAKKYFVSPGQVISYFIGAGGSGESGANSGGDTWFFNSNSLRAQGGRGASNNNVQGGAGGDIANSIGDVLFSGGNGGRGSGDGECEASGGGGSSAGPTANGNNGANAISGDGWAGCSGKTAGVGGLSIVGSWNVGAGGLGATNTTGGTGNHGNTGSGYGSGGGGAKKGNAYFFGDAWRVKNGGDGTSGVVRITVFHQHTVTLSGLSALCEGTATTLNATSSQAGNFTWNVGGVGASKIVTPLTNTTYTVTSTSSASGCTSTASHTVNVTPKWNAPTSISGGGDYCIGNTVNLAVEGGVAGVTYEWLRGGCSGAVVNSASTYTLSPNTSETLYVRAAAHGDCPASDCTPVNIHVNEAANDLSVHLDESTCPVSENEWIHFYNSGRLLLSLNSFGQNLGRVRVVSYVDPTSQLVAACNHADNEVFSTSVMNRHWAIYPEVEPISPVQVKLPFYNSDLSSLIISSHGNSNPLDNILGIEGLILSKYHGPTNVNGDFSDNCESEGGDGGVTSHGLAGIGLVSQYASITNAQYTQFTVNNLSEFWLHGSDKMVPLGILMDQFKVDCATDPIVSFRLDRVSNVEKIVVSGSADGQNWQEVVMLNSTDIGGVGPQILQVKDQSGEVFKYYSIEAFDFEKASLEKKIIVSNCSHSINNLELYPNPSLGEVILDWNSESAEATLVVMSVEGKVVEYMDIRPKQKISLHHIAKGTYWLQIVLPNGQASVQRLILQ